jgi:DNA invertase Pin-like site-specific DNA recombinase
MKKIGYARVSTEDQTLALQLDALRSAGCDAVHEDRLSGVAANRPGLTAAMSACAPGDVLTVWKLDRLGRSMAELVGIVDDLRGRGVGIKVLTGEGAAIDTTRPEGRLIFGVFAAFAEFERELIRERTREGMKAARRRGKRLGRTPALGPDKLDMARRLIAENKGRAVVAAMLGVDPSTLRRALNGKSP